LKRTINNEQELLKTHSKLLEAIVAKEDSKILFKESGLLKIWVKYCEDSFASKKSKDQISTN
jgi:rRNA pseudouridine-1189 N-methylase Emg1 (Nep1/Mra1 family)